MKKLISFLTLIIFVNITYAQKEVKYYFENGNLKETGFYMGEGVGIHRIGEWKEYYENGSLKKISYYTDETNYIGSKEYYEDGGLKFDSSNPKESAKEYYPKKHEWETEGKLYAVYGAKFVDGKKEGVDIYYYENNNIKRKVVWINGK